MYLRRFVRFGLAPASYLSTLRTPRRRLSAVARLAVLLAGVLLCVTALRPQQPVTYIYDQLGRLVGVVDPAGNAAKYSYDAVGNILSITRYNAGTVTIINFLPNSGPIGTVVTINGTGFSATPSQNTVKFNGVTATVNSSTTTSIVAVVPAGATTGTIQVTSPSGSATSSGPFTVTIASDAPTITAVTVTGSNPPSAIGVLGTPITITGSNFDPVPANDRTKHNVTYIPIGTATTTSLTSTAGPSSGRVTVATVKGTGTSSVDFFVAPPPKTAGNVQFTGRVAQGGSISVPLTAPGAIGLVVVDATAGQRFSITDSNHTFASCANVTLYAPSGATLGSSCMGAGSFADFPASFVSGTHTIMVENPNSGSATLTVNGFTDVTGTITPNGSPVVVNITIPGQNARLTFGGTAGQKVSLATSASTLPNCSADVFLLNPSGTTLNQSGWCAGSGNGLLIDATTLPTTGTYTVFLNPSGTSTGSTTFTLYTFVDITGTITPGGAPVTVTTTTPGQNALLTFSGTAGQKVSLAGSNSTYPSCGGDVFLVNPNGTTLNQSGWCVGAGNGLLIDATTLPTTGTYTVFFNPGGMSTGSTTFTLYTFVDVTGTIAPGGAPVTVTTTIPGQNALLTFSGTAGQKVSLVGSNSAYPNCSADVSFLNPDGSTLNQSGWCIGGGNGLLIDATTLPTTGTYTVFFNPGGMNTGSTTLTLYTFVDVTGPITAGGAPVTVTTTTPGQNALLTFSGTAGQKVSLTGSNSTYPNCSADVSFLKPDGSTLSQSAWCIGSGNGLLIDATTLPTTGAYTVFFNPGGMNTGSTTLTLYNVVDVVGTITPNGASVPVSITTPGQNAYLTFSGTAGQLITVSLTGNSISGVTVSLLNPDGTTATSSNSSAASFSLAQQTLATTGTYNVKVDPNGANTGSITVTVTSP